MWTLTSRGGKIISPDLTWQISDGRVRFDLAHHELTELWLTLGVLLGKKSFSDLQAEYTHQYPNKPGRLRGDIVTVDPEDPNKFILRFWSKFPCEFRITKKCRPVWRVVEYRMSRSEAENLLETEDAPLEDFVHEGQDQDE